MTDEQKAELRRLEKMATSGPWVAASDEEGAWFIVGSDGGDAAHAYDANAALIVAADGNLSGIRI